MTVQPPAAGTPGSGAAGTGVATATIPASAFPSNPVGKLTYTLAADTTTQTSSGSVGTLSINVPASNPSAPSGSVVNVSFNTQTKEFTLVSPVITRPGARVNRTVKPTSSNGLVMANDGARALSVPVLATHQVTAPRILALQTFATLTSVDDSGASSTIQIPVTIYAPGETADVVSISIDQNGNFGTSASGTPRLSRDGLIAAFPSSATNIASFGNATAAQMMRYAVSQGTVDMISQAASISGTMGGTGANGASANPALSADGLSLSFASDAPNVYPFSVFNQPVTRQIYTAPASSVISTLSPSPIPATTTSTGSVLPYGFDRPSLSSDGTILAFDTTASLVPSVTAGTSQVYVKNITTGQIQLASASASGLPGNKPSLAASLSDDGRYVLFESDATNLVVSSTPISARQIYLKDMNTGSIALVSASVAGVPGNATSTAASLSTATSFDGRVNVASFDSDASNLVSTPIGGTRQIYAKALSGGNLPSGAITLVTVATDGSAAGGTGSGISADGRFVAFSSAGANLVANTTSSTAQIYVRDLYAGKTALITTDFNGLPANGASTNPTLSGDGRTIGFISMANNMDGTGTNGVAQAYLANNPLTAPLANGFWANANLPGVYYVIEQASNKLWFGALGYNPDASANWTFSYENALTTNSFTGTLFQTAGGQTLTGPYMSAVYGVNLGPTTLTVGSQTTANLTWGPYVLGLQRYEFVSGGASAGPVAGYPETGWWYNPAEPDRALFLEVQGSTLFAAFTAYGNDGKALWYQTLGSMSAANSYAGNLYVCTGLALSTCTTNAGAINLAFSSTLAATMTLPNGNKIPMQRWRF